jgi:hypothetical protein
MLRWAENRTRRISIGEMGELRVASPHPHYSPSRPALPGSRPSLMGRRQGCAPSLRSICDVCAGLRVAFAEERVKGTSR